jgi:hypothetical protein
MEIPIPKTLPLFLNDPRPEALAVIDRILKGQTDLAKNLVELGRYWRVRVWFSQSVTLNIRARWKRDPTNPTSFTKNRVRTVTDWIFGGFFTGSTYGLCYSCGNRRGYPFDCLDKVIRYEPVARTSNEFESYEQFKAKFDPLFITEAEIVSLWNSKSGQHGGKYRKSDFRQMGPQGLRVMKDFLVFFKGVNEGGENTPGYSKYDETHYTLDKRYTTYHHFGRDIHISHQTNIPRVFYASEYCGCSNGRYGLVANKREFLWLEDD